MRILILNIILFLCTISLSAQYQQHEFKKYKGGWGHCLGGYNDSILGDYDKKLDTLLEFDLLDHAICKVKVGKKYIESYRGIFTRIYDVEVLDVLYMNGNFRSISNIKKKKFFTAFSESPPQNTVMIGIFAVDNRNYLVLKRELKLSENIRNYYIISPMTAHRLDTCSETKVDKVIKKIQNKKSKANKKLEKRERRMVKTYKKIEKKIQREKDLEEKRENKDRTDRGEERYDRRQERKMERYLKRSKPRKKLKKNKNC